MIIIILIKYCYCFCYCRHHYHNYHRGRCYHHYHRYHHYMYHRYRRHCHRRQRCHCRHHRHHRLSLFLSPPLSYCLFLPSHFSLSLTYLDIAWSLSLRVCVSTSSLVVVESEAPASCRRSRSSCSANSSLCWSDI